jgi:8-oxo-dGTP pyrophosphatase MutT (NUDIX family)
MASVRRGKYVMVVLSVGGSNASGIKLVLQREPRTGKSLFLAGSILPNEEHVDVAVRELFEETGHPLTSDDLTMLRNKPVRVSLPEGEHHLVYAFSTYVPVPYVTANLPTPPKVSQVVIA